MDKWLFLLIEQQEDYTKIYGIYDDYQKAEIDYYNLKKYNVIYGKLNIYKLDANKFYSNENYERVI